MARVATMKNPPGDLSSTAGSHSKSKQTGGHRSAQFRTKADRKQANGHAHDAAASLQPDRAQLKKFFSTLFKRATPGGYISLRSFPDHGSGNDKPVDITAIKLNGKFDEVIDHAFQIAERAAKAKQPVVFCPPVAVFSNAKHASENDLAEGVTLSVECDTNAQATLKKLKRLLGPPTVVVASGGEWTGPKTGELKPKLHIHYRLKKPARSEEELAQLKTARKLATKIVGGDASNVTIVHPIRWPGSWHRKSTPKLARIVNIDAKRELDLDKALKVLKQAAPDVDYSEHVSNQDKQADPDLIYAAMVVVPNNGVQGGDQDEWDAWNNIGMAIWLATGGDPRGFEAFDMWSMQSPKYNAENTKARWKHYFRHPPTKIGAGSIIMWANEAQPEWREEYDKACEEKIQRTLIEARKLREAKQENGKQKTKQQKKQDEEDEAATEEVIDPVDLWGKREAPPLPKGLLPKVIEKFAFSQAKLMGCDPAGLAMGALTVCAAAIPDGVKLQVKEHDPRWKESTRLWTAFAGSPSVVKSPVMDRVTEPLNRIDAELSRKYQEAKTAYEELSAEEKKNAGKPRHHRVRIEDVTPEAAQPILRDSPDGVLLVRDELSGWFGSIDKYSGARGGGMDRGFWLQAFNGKHYSWDRVGRGSGNIPNLSISVLGGIQEEPLRKVVNEGVDDGLIQRLFIIMLRPAVMGRDEPQPDDQYDDLVERLHKLSPDGADRSFSKAAHIIRRQLEQQHIDLAAGYEKINKKLAAHIIKYKGLFARLCLLWHCIENIDNRWPSYVDEDIAQRVADFMNNYLLQHAVAFYIGLLGMSDQHDRLLDVGGYILAHKLDALTTRDIQRGSRSMREMEKRDTDRIFEQLEAYGWLKRVPGRRYGDVTWEVNPQVHRLFAKKAKEERERRQRERAEILASMSK
jgi:Protein of unknown function (DUF3987)/Primase C terminal 2 (PriCT-2)